MNTRIHDEAMDAVLMSISCITSQNSQQYNLTAATASSPATCASDDLVPLLDPDDSRDQTFLVHIDAHLPQVLLCLLDLEHQFLVRRRYVVEGQDTPAQAAEEVCPKGDEEPEGDLEDTICQLPCYLQWQSRSHTYNRDDLLLDFGR